MRASSASRTAALSVALAAALLAGARLAHAAATLVQTSPTRYEALTHAPDMIRLRFSEAIDKQSSSVTLTDLSGHQVRVTPVKVTGDSSLAVKVVGKLGAGVYMVHFTSVSAADGSKTTGSYQFTVQ